MTDDGIIAMDCPCCESSLRISEENMDRLMTMAFKVHRTDDLSVDISKMPPLDWTGPVSRRDIARAVRDAVSTEVY